MQLGTQEQGKGMCPPAGRGAGPHPGSQSRLVLPLSEEIASVWLLEPVPSLGRAGCCRSEMGCVGFGTGSSPVSRPWHSSGMCLISPRSLSLLEETFSATKISQALPAQPGAFAMRKGGKMSVCLVLVRGKGLGGAAAGFELALPLPGSNIEKSVKDLQRCTVSLARYRVVVKEEMDASIKKMKQVFAELQSR